MRELKFRIWDGENKKMYFVDRLNFGYLGRGDGEYTSEDFYYGIRGHSATLTYKEHTNLELKHSKIVFQQYTELQDRYGKEIYEGDIVKYKNWTSDYVISEVTFNPQCGWCGLQDLIYADSYLEIIGNVYENPELIKT